MLNLNLLKSLDRESFHCASHEAVREITAQASSDDILVFTLSAEGISCDDDLFQAVAQKMKFPDYFGSNWDALDECLADLSWLPGPSYVFFLENPEYLLKRNPETACRFISSWLFAAEQWRKEGVPFHLVFVFS